MNSAPAYNPIADVEAMIDDAPLSATHLLVLVVCFLTSFADGFDTQMVGFAAPAVARDLGFQLAAFGAVFAAAAIGSLAGAPLLGALGDRLGRRNSLAVSTSLFAAATFMTVIAADVPSLVTLRLAAGVGLGGAMPAAVTLVSEYAPARHRALATGLLWCGYPCGGLAAGVLGALLVPAFGWRAIFVAGGVAAVTAAALQIMFLPESPRFLLGRHGDLDRARAVLSRLVPGARIGLLVPTALPTRAPIGAVFAPARRALTLLLWLPLLCVFLISGFFVLWLPALLQQSGYGVATVALLAALNNLAAVPSQAAAGWVVDHVGPVWPVVTSYIGMAVCIALVAVAMRDVAIVTFAMLMIGVLQGPGIAGMIHVAARIYPSRIRSTGVGLALGVSRFGLVLGSLLVGREIAAGRSPEFVTASVAGAALVATIGALLLFRRTRDAADPLAVAGQFSSER